MGKRSETEVNQATGEQNEASEVGRKYNSTPEEHLRHLLNIGWAEISPLIQKCRRQHNLYESNTRELR